jgi:hypothetical protein
MDCGEIKERLSEYLDDVLDAERKAVVEEHLSICKDCHQEMVSLKALVRELGSMESVGPPKDFLDQLHERIEGRSWFPKILRTLFVPVRVKIPLEFAGAVAVAILVFAVLHTQKAQLGLEEAPVDLKQERAAERIGREDRLKEVPVRLKQEKAREKGTGDTFPRVAKDKAYRPQSAYRGATEEQPPEEREAIELALVMKKEIRPESLGPGAAMEAAPSQEKKTSRSLAAQKAAPSARPETDEGVTDPLSKLTRVIEVVGGEVVSVEYDEQTNTPASIRAEIPAKHIHTFYKKLKELGDLQALPEAVTGKEEGVLPVQIRLLPSE